MEQENYTKKLARAQKRVKDIKGFYSHLRIYIIINIVLLFFKSRAVDFFKMKGIQDEGFFDWFEWNIIGTPILWGIGLAAHAFYVFRMKSKPLSEFKPRFIRDWEKRQLEKFMNEDQ